MSLTEEEAAKLNSILEMIADLKDRAEAAEERVKEQNVLIGRLRESLKDALAEVHAPLFSPRPAGESEEKAHE